MRANLGNAALPWQLQVGSMGGSTNIRPAFSLGQAAKALAWRGLHLLVAVARAIARVSGRTRPVDVIIYKVDRLGDWLLAEPAIARLVAATKARGGTVVVWAGRESDGLRKWRAIDCPVVTLVFEPHGWWARTRRTWAVIRLLAEYQARTMYCLRHPPDPVRDFVLGAVSAPDKYALSWRIVPGDLDAVPHEVRRHYSILHSAGVAPRDVRELLPRLAPPGARAPVRSGRIIIAPFSSAPIKDWPTASWSAVVSAFAGQPQEWELWVGPDQIARAQALADLLQAHVTGALDITVRSGSLADLGQAIAAARLVLAVDTLAAHIAAAVDAPLICILGGGQYGDFAPWSHSDRQRWVTHPLPCFNCSWHCTRPRNDCIQLINPVTVVTEMTSLWLRETKEDTGSARCVAVPDLPGAERSAG